MTELNAEYVITAERVHTLSNAPIEASAVAISAGRVAAVGSTADALAAVGASATHLEFPGGTIVPGFTDAHSHPIASISVPRGVDLSGAKTLKQVAVLLAEEVARASGSWVFGSGLDPNVYLDESITNQVLHEALGPDLFGHVAMFDGHSAVVTPNVLALAGVTEGITYPDGSRIVADTQGRLTGHILEFSALKRVRRALPLRSPVEKARDLYTLLAAMAATGITSAHVLDMQDPDTLEILRAAEHLGPLPVFLRLSPWCTPDSSDEEVRHLIELQGTAGDRWIVEGIKLFMDGTVEGGTAWLESPDTLGECTEPLWREAGSFERRLAEFHKAAVPTATHAIGDRAVRCVVTALSQLPASRVIHRVEHLESVDHDVVRQLTQAGVAASMQPTHCTQHTRSDGSDLWSQRVGPVGAQRAWCTQDVIELGGVLALGSDYPVAHYNPLSIMADAQLRRPCDDSTATAILPEQGLTAAQALQGFTTHAAMSVGDPVDSGRLTVGAAATLTVLNVDPLNAEPEELAKGCALLTVSNGLITHHDSGHGLIPPR